MIISENTKTDIILKAQDLPHKTGVNLSDWDRVNPKLLIVINWLTSYADSNNLPLKITSLIRPKIKGVSTSTTHEEGRAFDISLIGWSDAEARECVASANTALKGLGAISGKTGKEAVAVYEDGISAGYGRHLHFQVRR